MNAIKRDEGKVPDWIEAIFKVGVIVLLIAGIVFAIIFFTTMFINVPVGHACILVNPMTQTISEPVLGATWLVKAPWVHAQGIYYAMTSTEMWTDAEAGTSGEYPAIHVLSKDGLDIEVDILIRYSLDPANLRELYINFPDLRWEDRAISSIVREDVRDVVAQYLALEIIEERELISVKMRETIFNSLITETSLHRALLDTSIEIDLRDIDPPQKFKEAIEAKLTAEQQKIQAEFEKTKILILAEATRESLIKTAEGQSIAIELMGNATSGIIEKLIMTNVTAEDAVEYLMLQYEYDRRREMLQYEMDRQKEMIQYAYDRLREIAEAHPDWKLTIFINPVEPTYTMPLEP